MFKDLNDEFPGLTIFGNKYGPPTIGVFAVYLEYIGSENFVDSFGRLKLYKRKNMKPCPREIIDSVYLMGFIFTDTNEIGVKQNDYKKKFGEKERHPDCLTTPASLSIEQKPKTVKPVKEFETDTEMFCQN